MVVVVVAAARAFHRVRRGGEYTELVDGGFKGAVGSGATMAAVALATSAGGPAGVALLDFRNRPRLESSPARLLGGPGSSCRPLSLRQPDLERQARKFAGVRALSAGPTPKQ